MVLTVQLYVLLLSRLLYTLIPLNVKEGSLNKAVPVKLGPPQALVHNAGGNTSEGEDGEGEGENTCFYMYVQQRFTLMLSVLMTAAWRSL